GRVMESGRTEDVIARPAHPYTMGLRRSFPDIRFPERALISIGGHPPRLSSAIPGCPFAPRCPFEQPICRTVAPRLEEVEPDRAVACHFADRAPELFARSHEPGVWERAA
ncbi:MAG: hypothetical protein JOZ05_19030, partial [Acetobacteraceae bacterium]|nr:hypothetical protein [Acetobacteraceae bacterium]